MGNVEKIQFHIHDFANLKEKRGEWIETNNAKAHGPFWNLHIYPRGCTESDIGDVSIYILCNGEDNKSDPVKVTIRTNTSNWGLEKFDMLLGCNKFSRQRRDIIKNDCNDNGTLTITVELEIERCYPPQDTNPASTSQQPPSLQEERPGCQNDVIIMECERCHFRFTETDYNENDFFRTHIRNGACHSSVNRRCQIAKNKQADKEKEKRMVLIIPPRIVPVHSFRSCTCNCCSSFWNNPITPEEKRKRASSTATTATASSSLWMKKKKKNEDTNGNKESVHQQHQLQPHLTKKKKKTARNNDDDDNEQQGTNYQEGNDEINIKEFEDWLRKCKSTSGKEQRPISDSNARSVINRVKDLTSGRGIGYKNWPTDIRFCGPTDVIRKGPVTLEYNLHSLLQDAKEFENKHGRDKGNGWVVQHPVRKLILYKDYITESREKNHVLIE